MHKTHCSQPSSNPLSAFLLTSHIQCLLTTVRGYKLYLLTNSLTYETEYTQSIRLALIFNFRSSPTDELVDWNLELRCVRPYVRPRKKLHFSRSISSVILVWSSKLMVDGDSI